MNFKAGFIFLVAILSAVIMLASAGGMKKRGRGNIVVQTGGGKSHGHNYYVS